MEVKDLLNKTLYCVPYDFISNCGKGIKTQVMHITITQAPSSLLSRYEVKDEYGNIKYISSGRSIIEKFNARIGGKKSSDFGGYETIYEGLYQTMDEAKDAMKAYINRELKKIESSIKSLEKRSENLNKCLW